MIIFILLKFDQQAFYCYPSFDKNKLNKALYIHGAFEDNKQITKANSDAIVFHNSYTSKLTIQRKI